MKRRFIPVVTLIIMVLTSCVSSKKLKYLQDTDDVAALNAAYNTDYDLTVQPGDRLQITVTTKTKELLEPFSSRLTISGTNANSGSSSEFGGAGGSVVERDGTIHLPILGRIYVKGKTHIELEALIQKKIVESGYILDPDVTIAVSNFRFLTLGAVASPGVKTSLNERLTIHEALALAGDLEITGLRKNVKVMRTVDGEVNTYLVDLTSEKSVMSSPAYYIKQNDVIYVESNKAENIDASASYKFLTVVMSFASFAASMAAIVIALKQ